MEKKTPKQKWHPVTLCAISWHLCSNLAALAARRLHCGRGSSSNLRSEESVSMMARLCPGASYRSALEGTNQMLSLISKAANAGRLQVKAWEGLATHVEKVESLLEGVS